MSSPAKESIEPERKNGLRDLEVKDAQIIFQSVWSELEEEIGREKLCFPREILWLNGAPGSGKATHTKTAMEYRDFTAAPIVVSDLLQSPEAIKRKDAGMLAGDKEVTSLIFRELLNPVYQNGAVVDGYPRSLVQVECLKLLYNKLNELRIAYKRTPLNTRFPKPQFHILVLFIDEAESVKRQMFRGQQAMQHNEDVANSGVGRLKEVRKTDLNVDAARNRYRTFKDVTYESLKSLREVFFYHYINAHGTIDEVRTRIVDELRYQSSLELDQNTYDRLSTLPIASEITRHARQELIKRLDEYERTRSELFAQVVNIVQQKFMPIIMRHAISGMAHVNTEDPVFEDPGALAMLIDVFSERGYHAVVDICREEVPVKINQKTFAIECRAKKVFRVQIRFAGSEIRRGR